MTVTRAVGLGAGGIALLLVGLIVRSSFEMSLGAGLRATVDSWWGITTMVDLYAGLAAAAAWIAYRERSKARAAGWIVGLALLGNLTTVVYLAVAGWRSGSLDELVNGHRRADAKPR